MSQDIEQLKAAQTNPVQQGLAINGGIGHALDHAFFDYFDIEVASEGSVVDAAHKLRYDVFCQEKGWESTAEHPEGLERDTYDRRSVHCLLRYRPTGQPVGCIRLVLSDTSNAQSLFPFESVFGSLTESTASDLSQLNRSGWAEVSRLALLPSFRAGKIDHYTDSVKHETAHIPDRTSYDPTWPWLGPCIAIAALTMELKLEGTFAMMERSLVTALRRCGFQWKQIDAAVEHRGLRAPYQLTTSSVLQSLKPVPAQLCNAMRKQIRPAMLAAGLMLEEKPGQRAA